MKALGIVGQKEGVFNYWKYLPAGDIIWCLLVAEHMQQHFGQGELRLT